MKMTKEEFVELQRDCRLRNDQVAFILGVTPRSVVLWRTGRQRVPQYAQLILMAFNERQMKAGWILNKIRGSSLPY